ncbi:hypothetical protein HYALB_00004689 [Hymenoscyphus albidus]|uniref:Amino acid transporter transmembrane domain-containing protein n=1 Tax=Hymenoscyphus albidus TaxID=595503 RepID=A0A9N9Q985_9HELO|nr:hypothetical protein HYALB_00004689 [Hymenoscyphus albidus]
MKSISLLPDPELFSTGRNNAVLEYPSPTSENNELERKEGDGSMKRDFGNVSVAEWKNASRAIRTAGWSSIFYLITTDILGPFSVPWAFAQMGYGPGIVLYTVFGALAMYSGFQIYKVFIYLDSNRYPVRTFGDLFFRTYGKWASHMSNILQTLQLLMSVSILILSNGQAISQISKGNLCFIACLIIFAIAGMLLGQIRTLQRLGWFANLAVWINILIMFICMGVVANNAPNFTAVESSFGPEFAEGPIHKYAGTPHDGAATGGSGFTASLNGLNQAIYSYGGAMLFPAFLAEMRHPFDLWKGLLLADLCIYIVYLFFGLFVYSYQGQYSYNPAFQGLSPYNWQTASNIMSSITGLIAAVLYGNIGIKVAYIEVFQEFFNFPPLTTKKGKIYWCLLVPIYWALVFVICASIPQFSYIGGLVGAVCILQFTYTFPAMLGFGFQIRKDAMLPDQESFDATTKTYNYVDQGWGRLRRGFKVRWLLNGFNFFYFLGSLTTAALGIYSSAEGLKGAFEGKSVASSWGCKSPTG